MAISHTVNSWSDAYLQDDESACKFYPSAPFNLNHGIGRAERSAWQPYTEAELAEWKELLNSHGASSETLNELKKLQSPDCLAILTGQQAGLGLGPLYTIYKALAAAKWARKMETETNRPVIALFWVASDDHDLAEANALSWIANDGSIRQSHAHQENQHHRLPMAKTEITPDLAEKLIEELTSTTLETEFREEILQSLRHALFQNSATFESQFLSLFLKWIAPLGIVHVIPSLGSLRKRALPIMRRELQSATHSSNLMMETGEKLRQAGLEPLIHRRGDEVNFFIFHRNERSKITLNSTDIFTIEGSDFQEEISREDLAELLESTPEAFSPNVVTRPLVADSLFPSVASVVGPGEIAYLAQVIPLYEKFSMESPTLIPRPSALLLDARVRRSAEKLSIPPAEFPFPDTDSLKERLQQSLADSGNTAIVSQARENVLMILEQLESQLAPIIKDTGVQKSVERLNSQTLGGFDKLFERVEKYDQQSGEAHAAAAEKLLNAIFPGGQPQERVLGVISPFLINYGSDVIQRIYDCLNLESPVTQLIDLTECHQPPTSPKRIPEKIIS